MSKHIINHITLNVLHQSRITNHTNKT